MSQSNFIFFWGGGCCGVGVFFGTASSDSSTVCSIISILGSIKSEVSKKSQDSSCCGSGSTASTRFSIISILGSLKSEVLVKQFEDSSSGPSDSTRDSIFSTFGLIKSVVSSNDSFLNSSLKCSFVTAVHDFSCSFFLFVHLKI